jgi:hypothetical protein
MLLSNRHARVQTGLEARLVVGERSHGDAVVLLQAGPRAPGHVGMLGRSWVSNPCGESLFLLHCGPRGPGHVSALGRL